VDEALLHGERRIDAACEAIQHRLDGVPIALTVYFDVDAFGRKNDGAASKRWLRKIPELLHRFVASADRQGNATNDELLAHGIDRIGRLEWEPSSRTSVMKGWHSYRPLGSTLVEAILAKKDERLDHYRRTNGLLFEEYWLAVGYIAPGVVDDGFSLLLQGRYETRYDRVFLLESDGRKFVRARDVTR
jgi:hypothetical protein